MATFVFVCIKPGNDIDGEPAEFCEHSLEAAQIRADRHARACGATLKLVGQKVNGRVSSAVEYDAAPWWWQHELDEQRGRDERAAAARARAAAPKRPRLSKAESAEVRSMIEDGGYTRAAALAWVRQFGAAS